MASKTAIITGGTSGIGLGLADRLVEDGFHVYLWARGIEAGRAAEASLNAKPGGGGATFQPCDVRSAKDIAEAAARFRQREDHLDLLVNSAGVRRLNSVMSFEPELVEEQVSTLLTAPLLVTSAMAADLTLAPHGVVINIGSAAGRESFPRLSAYGAAKAGLVHFTRTAAMELFASGVRVICVCPGVVATPMIPTAEAPFLAKALPRQEFQTVSEIVDVILDLASPRYASMTGTVVDIDNGVLLFPGGPRDVPKR